MVSQEEMLSQVLIMVLMVLPSRTYGETLHVRPTSANASCPTHPCHTLSEYAQNLEQYFNESNLKLQFVPGNHTLNVNLTITSIYQLEMLGNTSAVVPTRIACSSNVGFTFRNTSNVKIDTLVFVSCARFHVTRAGEDYLITYYGLHLQLVQRTEINDCTFQDSYGSALGIVDSHVVLRGRNSFLNNCKLCSNGKWCSLRGLTCYGGGVSAHRSNLNFTGKCIFGGNAAFSGGGIYSGSYSKLNLSGNTEFIYNSALYGGGVYSHSSSNTEISGNNTFIGNSVQDGGGVYSNSNLTIGENTTFIGNSASSNGGGVYAGSNMNINGNTTFIGNFASSSGGGVYVGPNSNINISGNAIFISNIARGGYDIEMVFDSIGRGGGVYISSSSNTNISGNTTFFGNSAGNNGGGVFLESANNVSICGNIAFISNSALNGGGVYLHILNNVSISGNSKFIGNSAGKFGGGIHSFDSNIVDISGNTTFIYNSATRNGGGVYSWSMSSLWQFASNFGNFHVIDEEIFEISKSSVRISGNTTFIGNSAIGNGGGVYAVDNSSVIIGGNALFRSNSAVYGGGGFFLESFLSLEGNINFKNCSASVGGAIYAKESQVNFIGTNIFSANRAAYLGGGLYASKCSFKLLGDDTFIGNSAETKGGGIYAQEINVKFIGTSLLSGNLAGYGGGIYVDGSNLNFSGNITIRNNTAQLGGGIYSDNNTFNIDGYNVAERNIATYYGGGIYTRRSLLTLTGNSMLIANSAGEGGGIYAAANTSLSLNGVNTFKINRAYISGGGIWLDNSNLTLNGSNHFVECVASYEGGAIFTYAATASLPGNSTFESNTATTGGGIHARWSDVRVTNSCSFKHNIAVFGGGVFTNNSTFTFVDLNTFEGNQANYTGGGVYAARSILNFPGTSFILTNRAARDGGGMYVRDDSVVNLELSNYQNNSAGDTGGGISAFQSNLNFAGQNTFDTNHAVEGGGFYAFKSTVSISGANTFTTNSASYHGGGLTVMHVTLHLNGSTAFKKNSAAIGGGMYIGDSRVDSDGSNCFINNMASLDGGGIDIKDSVVEVSGKDAFVFNSAKNKGAAVHVSFATLLFQGSSSFVSNSARYGGGIYSESSNLTFIHHESSYHAMVSPLCKFTSTIPEISFLNNTAIHGGAQYFDLTSNFNLDQTAHVHFQNNHATEFGGAIYVVDVPRSDQFLSQQYVPFRNECFFHIFGKETSLEFHTNPLVFVNNSAGIRGSVLYGGLLEKCNFTSDSDRYTNAMEFFSMSILHVEKKDDVGYSISSDPTQLCFCDMSELSCGKITQSRSIYPGQQVVVSVVAVDQSGLAIPTFIHTSIHSGNTSETISYETEENCTSRNYSIIPRNLFNKLEFHPSNKSGSTIHLFVNIAFKSCPIGFEQSNFTGECICDHRLWQYTNSCDLDRRAILRNATSKFWLSVSYNNEIPEGFIHNRYCPLDYCTSESKHINLCNPDEQCNFNRSELLCGKCKEGLSLVLGSSQCMRCSNNYLALLIPFAMAGVLLVLLLFLLHLTVTAGTLHGLIFYANIVEANHHIFFPQSSNNPASIFIAWLNLDLGIQTCFYNGMDAYAKTWLEFVFPVYIWVMVGFLVYISHHSVAVTKLLGSNPVPVLATLFLLSYAKVLRTIIAALSLTILHYPDKNVVVWIHDATVTLVKYIPLAVIALLFLLFLFLPYTLLLLLGQWIQSKSHLCLLSWVKSPKLKAILDTYHAPYKPKHQYWIGLLLLVRCALFLIYAFNVSGDDSVNLLVISSATFGIFVMFALSGVVYKSWCLNALEVSFILNLGMLAAATYHVNQSGGSQAAVAYTSVGIAFLTFVGIIIYHVCIRIKSKVKYIQRGNRLQHKNNNISISENKGCHPRATPNVTHTEVNLHELRSPLDLLSYHQMN